MTLQEKTIQDVYALTIKELQEENKKLWDSIDLLWQELSKTHYKMKDDNFLLNAELDRVRGELKSEKSFSSNLASDALSALSQFTCTPEKGYLAEPLVLPWDIERLGRERDHLKSENLTLSEAHEAAQHYKKEMDQLREKLEIAVEALDRISDPTPSIGRPSFADWELRQIAREALAKLRGEK